MKKSVVLLAVWVSSALGGEPARFSSVAEAKAAAVRKYPALAVEGSPMNAAFVREWRARKDAEFPVFERADWPMRLADEVADLLARPAQNAAVESVIVKRIEVPGLLWGKNTVFRYFFSVENTGRDPFTGTVKIEFFTARGDKHPTVETFSVEGLPPRMKKTGFIDTTTGTAAYHGDFAIVGYWATITPADGTPSLAVRSAISSRFENLAP